ncbi:Stf0 family sulfotransferase [Gymnodinialimonas sp.]
MDAYKAYMICTSPRSGSTLLCKLLQDAKTAGAPDSHFHAPSLEKWLGYYDLQGDEFPTKAEALDAVFEAAIARGTAGSGVFGLRIQRPSFLFFVEQLALRFPSHPDDKARIEAAFGRTLFVHLTRESKLDQAISFVRATQSGLWHRASDGTELERLSAPRETVYDAKAIASQLEQFEQMDRAWEAWFEVQNITPLRLTYDTLSADPHAALSQVLTALGLEAATTKTTPPTAKLADGVNDEWAARFRAGEGL